MGLQGLARATKDIDLFVRPVEANVERLRRALRSVYQDDCVDDIRTEDLAGDYPVVRYGPPEVGYLIDIIGRIGEAWGSKISKLNRWKSVVLRPKLPHPVHYIE